MPAIFIDGEAGTTGLSIRQRLSRLQAEGLSGLSVLAIAPEHRKDPAARLALMAEADLVILCLPDEAAKEAVALAASLGDAAPRVLDASSAHRVAPGWSYGFPEITPGRAAEIAAATLVSNPGCYATGAIALLAPLVEAGLLPTDYPVTINAVSGYSGGGNGMIDAHQRQGGPPFELYALGLEHKHIPEIVAQAGLDRRPIFVPSVGHFRQGMLVSIPLHLETLTGAPTGRDLAEALSAHFPGPGRVSVHFGDAARLEAETLNETDLLELHVLANEDRRQAVLVARLDNLGKGASGAAVQNALLMLGLPDMPARLAA